MENTGSYGRYIIDSVLGRLQCPPDLKLLYNKARLHAFTSFVLPDPLTGRTGTEEALCCLGSGYSQPWTPLSLELTEILETISNLTPRRRYYPEDLECQQIVQWSPQLTTTIQHDAYQPLIDSIRKKSERLSLFHRGSASPSMGTQGTIDHLRERSQWRRSIYEPSGMPSAGLAPQPDLLYPARDRWSISTRACNTREIVALLQLNPSLICTTPNLGAILQKWPFIGGYANEFAPHTLENCLSANLAEEWGGLINLCKRCGPEDVYQLMFHLGAVAFRKDVDLHIMRTAVAFFVLKELKELDCPSCPSFTGFRMHEKPKFSVLTKLVNPYCKEFVEPQIPSKKKKGSTSPDWLAINKSRQQHREQCDDEVSAFVQFLIQQWPNPLPSVDGFEATVLDHHEALQAVFPEWQRLHQNLQLSNHVTEVQAILDRRHASSNAIAPPCARPESVLSWPRTRQSYAALRLGEDLLRKTGPKSNVFDHQTELEGPQPHQIGHRAKNNLITVGNTISPESQRLASAEIDELETIVDGIMGSNCSVKLNYGQDLKQSIAALRTNKGWGTPQQQIALNFNYEIMRARNLVSQSYVQICHSLSYGDSSSPWLRKGNLWPRVTPSTILEQLRSTSHRVFGPGMKSAFISYALAIINLQRLLRMQDAFLKHDRRRLNLEYENSGHVSWEPSEYPDWLLLEIDTNIQIRDDQVTVALEMISPTSDANSVLQMNMGQGKTSVIMPMIACVLADSRLLARLLVPKALLSQTAQILQSRLGGLLGKEITYIPFSRRTPTISKIIKEYHELHKDMLRASGIILGIPEHVLSFKLSGLQRLSDLKIPEATKMIEIQSWMDHVCRDILDECDFTLAVKTQLIYPSGSQLPFDGHPNRWKIIQILLNLVESHLHDLTQSFPQSINIVKRTGAGFPVVYFLRKDVEDALVNRVVDDINSGQVQFLPIQNCTNAEQHAIKKFISQKNVDPSDVECVKALVQDTPKSSKALYLLRGLLAHGILLLCLKKRWNVQYGLHPGRDPIAVPFHAKGVPSEQAEWGHPDVAIVFTCLAFYYEGLTEKQLKQSLQAVLNSDDPATEYDRWTQASPTLPEALRHWNIINVDDDRQMAEIWKNLRFTIVVINHFLNKFVFPVHSKQFTVKLQASGWDVPLFSNGSNDLSSCPTERVKRPGLTTGFSGTNDNRRLLPLTIEQQDLPGLSHTNAEVLTYLLQERNRQYMLAANTNGLRLSELDLLDRLTAKGIRILIDAGAFILEMHNKALVKAWLAVDYQAQAAVYFGSDNKPWVVHSKTGKTIPLLASPFVDNLENCLVYIDQAHTRGTDLSLPVGARGALTLGVHQTKDHTVQAAMRLRQLGTTQSVTFVAPPEVHYSILDVCEKDQRSTLDSSHVVTWLLDQTCASNNALQPLYLAQGENFCRRMLAEETYNAFLNDPKHRNAFLEVLQQPEQRTLEELYEPKVSDGDALPPARSTDLPLGGKFEALMEELRQRRQRSHSIGHSVPNSALEEVEQEREVAYEIEEEREVQRPVFMKALVFPGLHESIRNFVKTGLLEGPHGYMKASTALNCTQLAAQYGVTTSSLLPHLFLSNEFGKTVELKHGERNDTFTRPVNWVLWSPRSETALVIIPEEAEAILPMIRATSKPRVHLLLYAAPVTRRMVHFNRLDYCAIPSFPAEYSIPIWLSVELGLFAGRLYFEFSEYSALLSSLQLNPGSSDSSQQKGGEGVTHLKAPVKKIISFLQEWMALRRQGQDITHTPMGYVCQGWRLRSDHPFFAAREARSLDHQVGFTGALRRENEDDDYDSGEEDDLLLDYGDENVEEEVDGEIENGVEGELEGETEEKFEEEAEAILWESI